MNYYIGKFIYLVDGTAKMQEDFSLWASRAGKECQRCKQKTKAAGQQTREREQWLQQKAAWNASFEQDAIDLRSLPKPIIKKARRICQNLATGIHFKYLGGTRFKFDRTIIRIPISGRYRMLCWDKQSHIVSWQVLSHVDYNAYASNRRQLS